MSRNTTVGIGVGVSLIATLGVATYLAGRRAIPSWAGQVKLDGLKGPVSVQRDKYGVPSIFAENEDDLFMVQGYVHASDRLFQLDLFRRVTYGRLAEIVGEPGLGSDKLSRVLGLGRMADAEVAELSPETLHVVEQFTRGVNAFMSASRRRLPLEFRLLGYKPDPWLPAHSLATSKLMSLGLCGNWEAEMVRAEIATRFGDDVLHGVDEDSKALPFLPQIDPAVLGKLFSAARDATATFGGTGGTGSNNWVIGPRRTANGGAVLANDPHLDLSLPAIWFENLLRCPGYSVRGFSIPGSPAVVLGHNGTIAWGFTNSCADVQDTYVEDFDMDAGTYKDAEGDLPIDSRTERIRIKGQDPLQFEVRSTRRGPVLSDAVDSTLEAPLSIRWDCVRPGKLFDAVLAMNRATNWEEFREAVRMWTSPSQNMVYADVHGNIGFQLSGEIPVRRDSDGSVPLRGDDPAGEWIGVIPFEELPHSFNPASDRIVTANDKLVPDDFPHFISREWMNGYRGDRIRELIDERDGHDVGSQGEIQSDVYSRAGQQLVAVVEKLDPTPTTEAGREVLRKLLAWDGELTVGATGSDEYRAFLRELELNTFGFLDDLTPGFLGYSRTGFNGFWSFWGRATPRLIHDIGNNDTELLELGARVVREGLGAKDAAHAGAGAHASGNGNGNGTAAAAAASAIAGATGAVTGAVTGNGRTWVDDREDVAPVDYRPARSWNEMVARALDAAGERLASGPARRRKHRIRFQHPMGVVGALAPLVNRGPYDMPGDPDTVWQASNFHSPLNDAAMVGPSQRTVYDMADLDSSTCVLAGGQSGHPASPHYVDQIALWRAGKSRPAPWSREAIESHTHYRQRFEPLRRV